MLCLSCPSRLSKTYLDCSPGFLVEIPGSLQTVGCAVQDMSLDNSLDNLNGPFFPQNLRFEDRAWTAVQSLHISLNKAEVREQRCDAQRCCLKLQMLFQTGDLQMGRAQTIDHSGRSLWDSSWLVLPAESPLEKIFFPHS